MSVEDRFRKSGMILAAQRAYSAVIDIIAWQ